jgi:hypothetical protein
MYETDAGIRIADDQIFRIQRSPAGVESMQSIEMTTGMARYGRSITGLLKQCDTKLKKQQASVLFCLFLGIFG